MSKHARDCNEASETQHKWRRLNTLRRSVPHCTKSALHAILTDVAEHGIPEHHAPKQMRQAAETDLLQWDAYGPLFLSLSMQTVKGKAVTVEAVNFFSFLHAAYKAGGCFSEWVDRGLAAHACSFSSPWQLLLYTDECHPGNALNHKGDKKIQMIYASFLEMGQNALSHADGWLPIFACRSNVVNTFDGNMSQIFREILKSIFCSTHGSPDAGVLLHSGTGRDAVRLHWTLGALVQDGAAQRAVWGVKGDSGSKYCLKCGSVWSTSVCEVTNKSMLFLSTDNDVLQSFDRLRAKKDELSADDFKLWQQATGWTWSDNHVLNCDELRPWLRPVSQFCHDYMHGMASGGCLNVAIFLLLEDLTTAGLRPWTSLQSYMSLWVLPGHLKGVCNMPSFFVDKRVKSHREAQKFKAPASDILCLFPVFAYYAKTIGSNASCHNSVRAFLACCHFMELLLGTHHNLVNGKMLDEAAEKVLTSFQEAGWGESCIKKFHWLLHYGDSLETHKTLVPCWAMERKHKQVTSVATCVTNLSHYEHSVYQELLSGQLHRLKMPLPQVPCLETLRRASKKLQCFVQQHMQTCGQTIHSSHTLLLSAGGRVSVRDVILVHNDNADWDCGELWSNFCIGPSTYSLVSLFELMKKDSNLGSYTWKEDPGQVTIIPAEDVVAAVTYSRAKAGLVTLIPWHLQRRPL